ncbi:hypothetical protein SAMN04515674_10812 [Pseudarcicella hirudinis]|uniref:Right handed beta helix region n=1 Tax=Pseudarcicella hirudinis TaxID=1079859 RepID=A0A1I5UQI4_9BACT|nr:hypothetical protein [Pseudarcicella hirudinis]SFP97495.1 hypothetical protein SAMN04515674_10812 [Pseudarcicella hirudinis]
MKKFSNLLIAICLLACVFSCSKSDEVVTVSQPLLTIGKAVDNKTPLSGSIKGTMKSDSVYNVNGDVFINENDTLLIQPGVKIYINGNYSIVVKGTLLSLGSKDKPIYFTVKNVTKTDQIGADPTTDPAYKGLWGGILGETTAKLLVVKWTHVEFGGGKATVSPVSFIANNGNTYPLCFSNPDGVFVLEDSWVYGSVDDPIRTFGGKLHVMRNTFEKSGFTGGECLNIKSGSVGNFAYNLFIGSATNGSKASNNGGKNPQTTIYMYNNTYIDCGYRRAAAGRGGSINFEEGSRGVAYNNLIVNCKYGVRIVGANGTYLGNTLVSADTANIKYGYNFNYVDSTFIANEIYPTGFATKIQSTDIPAPGSFLPASYKPGQVYDGSAVVGKNNPSFVNFPLPQTSKRMRDISVVGTYNFRLQSNSPALGKGFTGFSPLANGVPVSANFGATEITPPNKDLGAYPSDNSGNKH